MTEAERTAARLTAPQRKALLAIDKPYGRVRWTNDLWDLAVLTINGVRIMPATQRALADLGLIWAKRGYAGYLPEGKVVRDLLLATSN